MTSQIGAKSIWHQPLHFTTKCVVYHVINIPHQPVALSWEGCPIWKFQATVAPGQALRDQA